MEIIKMKKNILENCWICGDHGNTGEHLIKASDVRLYFPGINQEKPLYYNNNLIKNKRIGSWKSHLLHSKAKLCKKCNNEKTQPYDKAWEILSNYLYRNRKTLEKRRYFDLKKVYIDDFDTQSKNLQLYFVKILGCIMWDCEVKDNTRLCNSFSESLLHRHSREDIYLKFMINNKDDAMGVISLPKDDEYKKYLNIELAVYRYVLPYFEIEIFYSSIKKEAFGWLPNSSKIIKLY